MKKIYVAPSTIAGHGLFLGESAKKDEFIVEYVGERITHNEAERRGAIYDLKKCSYLFSKFIFPLSSVTLILSRLENRRCH